MRRLSVVNSNFTIPIMGQGMMGIGGFFEKDNTTDSQSIELLRKGFEQGLNFADTAEIYGSGHSEEFLGAAVKDCRSSIVIGTKFSPENSSSRHMHEACSRSLDRLKTDYIDLYQSHWPNNSIPFKSTIDGFNSLLEKGLIKYVCLCNATKHQIKLASSYLPKGKFIGIQQAFNFADRFAEHHLLPTCRNGGRVMIAYSPLMEGRLLPNDGRRDKMKKIAQESGLTLAQLIMSWLSQNKSVCIIPKVSKINHMLDNVNALEYEMPKSTFNYIDSLYKIRVEKLITSEINTYSETSRKVYQSLEEAVANKNNMSPSPKELSKEYIEGELFKPIKVSHNRNQPKPYTLVEGGLRYWAWVIAHGFDSRIDAIII